MGDRSACRGTVPRLAILRGRHDGRKLLGRGRGFLSVERQQVERSRQRRLPTHSPNHMTTRIQENARTLASLLGTTEECASSLLDITVLITVGSDDARANQCAKYFEKLISRTVSTATTDVSASAQVEVVFGSAEPRTTSYV